MQLLEHTSEPDEKPSLIRTHIRLATIAHAEEMDRPVDDPRGGAGGDDLDASGLGPGANVANGVREPGGSQDQEPTAFGAVSPEARRQGGAREGQPQPSLPRGARARDRRGQVGNAAPLTCRPIRAPRKKS
jgi:hypothetical protein